MTCGLDLKSQAVCAYARICPNASPRSKNSARRGIDSRLPNSGLRPSDGSRLGAGITLTTARQGVRDVPTSTCRRRHGRGEWGIRLGTLHPIHGKKSRFYNGLGSGLLQVRRVYPKCLAREIGIHAALNRSLRPRPPMHGKRNNSEQ